MQLMRLCLYIIVYYLYVRLSMKLLLANIRMQLVGHFVKSPRIKPE